MPRVDKRQRRRLRQEAKRKAALTKRHLANRKRNLESNIERYGRRITRVQFDAYCYCRMPLVRFTAEEVEWYSLCEHKLLGVVLRDVADDDYGFVLLGRDDRRLFRCVDVGTEFHRTPEEARKALARHIAEHYAESAQDTYPQGDDVAPALDLFVEVVPPEKQHHNFRILFTEPRYEAARNLIQEIANSFVDADGHYAREFQSINFHARLWELYLHVYFHNAGLLSENNHVSPDFELLRFDQKVFVEAVTVNASTNPSRPDLPPPTTDAEVEERLNDYMPIKFGSALYSKLCKEYWRLDHVAGHPLILAVHDYHSENAMTWSRTALSEYLYGIRARIEGNGAVVRKIQQHVWLDKEIQSGFFYQENARHISAVLFSNQATIPKFNRMGRLAGLGSEDVKMMRVGYRYNPAPGALHPIRFALDLDDPAYEESWADGLVMFHNPMAATPVDPNVFPDISHVFYSEEHGFYGHHQPFDVLGSMTIVVSSKGTT